MTTYLKEVCVISLAAVEIAALCLGFDGAYLTIVVAAIAGLGGFYVGKKA